MEYVLIGGAGDGRRVDIKLDPPTKYFAYPHLVLSKAYQSWAGGAQDCILPEQIPSSEYRLECLSSKTKKVCFYVDTSLSLDEALELLVSNYAISDPSSATYNNAYSNSYAP